MILLRYDMHEYHAHGPPATLDFLPCEVENAHMDPQEHSATRLFTALSAAEQEPGVRLAVESLRTFGGPLCSSPVWVFTGREPGSTSLESKAKACSSVSRSNPNQARPGRSARS